MNLKTKCIRAAAIVLLTACILPAPSNATNLPADSTALRQGGQSAPGAVGGSDGYTVLVADNLSQATADALQANLKKEGFTSAVSLAGENGKYEVVLGGLSSRGQAEALLKELKKSGYTPETIIEGQSSGASSSATSAGDKVYRVEVAEFPSEQQAEQASKVLAGEGFVNVDVVKENDKNVLMLGTFNKKADAEALLTDVNKAGFALAAVVSRERMRASIDKSIPDLSGLPTNERAETKEVLDMAKNVNSGNASAAEIKLLREKIQQLNDGQKAILGKQESNRSADREKLERIYTLYRQFDKSMKAKDFTGAEQALAQVRQIEPTEMFLAGKVNALDNARGEANGTARTAPAPVTPGSNAVDPAVVQSLINDGRNLENAGKQQQALGKYRQVLTMQPTNVTARAKIAELDQSKETASAEGSGTLNDIMKNKTVLYAAGGLVVLIIIIILWLKSRGSKTAPSQSSAAMTSGTDFGDPIAGETSFNSPMENGSEIPASTALSGADMTAFHIDDEEEEAPEPKELEPAQPAAAVEDNDMVSLEDFESGPQATVPQESEPQDSDSISLDEEPVEPEPEISEEKPVAPAAGGSAMDADLETLLKGTFPGAAETEPDQDTPDVAAVGADADPVEAVSDAIPASSQPRVVFEQNFDDESDGSTPADWRGEYDYATLAVCELNDAGHAYCLKYEKPEGLGSATYHLKFPRATGNVTAEFDVRCDQKNKFLLGVYLEKDEDFKQSIHTIVHQLDPNVAASLRLQGDPAPYEMGSWVKVRYEINLEHGTLNGFMGDEQVITEKDLSAVPDYVNTLSIRDNLATTGTLYLDNIRISES